MDILEGVTERSPRSEILGKLREVAGKVYRQQDDRLGELQKIEEQVRKSWAGRSENLVQIIATSTEAEWSEVVDFLDNFEDVMPVGLYRVFDGARTALGRQPVEGPDGPDADDGGGDSV